MRARTTLWLIILLVVFALWTNLPSSNNLPSKVNIAGKELDLGFLKNDKFEPFIFGVKVNLDFLTPARLSGLFPIKL
ncbi:MAG: hypothetical protein M1142_05085, partial [Patescibacteria group bacterium]|nr:hypothetical protein [Patescibacteria group bacterium]